MASGKWALEVPMHMDPDNHSPEADEIRVHLYNQFFHRVGAKGFRTEAFHSPKRRRPRRGRIPGFNRMVAIALNAKFGERTDEPTPR